ncbi:MAG: hypothetical protein R6U91_08160 [Bacillota bacterium]
MRLRDHYNIKPIIDIRNMWKDGDKTSLASGQTNVVYDYCGNVFCYCPKEGQMRQMAFGGFEQDRQTLKYRCSACHYGISCAGKEQCPVNKAIRIPLEEDPRIFLYPGGPFQLQPVPVTNGKSSTKCGLLPKEKTAGLMFLLGLKGP